jgi:hypothetical protein
MCYREHAKTTYIKFQVLFSIPKKCRFVLGHGAREPGEEKSVCDRFFNLAKRYLINTVCISAHWFTKGQKVTAMEMQELFTIWRFSASIV